MSSKPEEDDDDWFTKDIDDFDVPDIKKPSEGDAEADTGTSLLESLKIKPKQFFDGECLWILIIFKAFVTIVLLQTLTETISIHF